MLLRFPAIKRCFKTGVNGSLGGNP
uniref:Uncharacterized protein n=1 Tax=Anguilla anguilla TaxID=7936 RepID=A0A0E9XE15_ANGAN